jgi:hypothetical protein
MSDRSPQNFQSVFQQARSDPSGTWTVMVYINGDDLNKFIATNVRQMERIAADAPSNVKIVVLYSQPTLLHDRQEYPVFPTGNGEQEWTGRVTTGYAALQAPPPRTDPSLIYTTFQLSRSNLGETRTLENFIVEAETQYPAQKYALILGDHGGGVRGLNYDANFRASAPDNWYLTPQKLVTALSTVDQAGYKVNLLAFDECMMAMTEVEYAVRNLVQYVVASEELIDGPGFNYETALRPLTNNPASVTPADLARSLVESFDLEYADDPGYQDTLSAVNTSNFDDLAGALRTFVADTASANAADWAGLRKARAYSAKFGGVHNTRYPYRDLGQFLDAVADFEPSDRIRSAAEIASSALEEAVVAKTVDQRDATGLSIVLPTPGEQAPAGYAEQAAAFLRASGWLNFLRRLSTAGAGAACSDPADWAEYNNDRATATAIGPMSGRGILIPELTLPRGDVDWYRFSLLEPGESGDRITLASPSLVADSRLELVSAQNPSAPIVQGRRDIDLSGLPAGDYLLEVSHRTNATSFAYSLEIDAPPVAGLPDQPATNHSPQTPQDLGAVVNPGLAFVYTKDKPRYSVFNRTSQAGAAWYEFETPRSITPLRGAIRVIGASASDLAVTLYNNQGQRLGTFHGPKVVQVPFRTNGAGQSFLFSIAGGAGTYEIFFSGVN